MAYPKAYQTVIAGRVREDEQIAFFGKNKVAVPGRVTSFNSTGGKKQPTIQKNWLGSEFVGKIPDVTNTPSHTPPALDVYVDNPYNLS